jgi:quercetin dioxygenase-like cupin family protein
MSNNLIVRLLIAIFCCGVVQFTLAHEESSDDRLRNDMKQGLLSIRYELQAAMDVAHVLSVLTVTLAPHYREPAHTHPGEEVLYVLSGEASIWIDGKERAITEGDVIHVPSGATKAIDNSNSDIPLSVLAYLALQKDKPPLELQ